MSREKQIEEMADKVNLEKQIGIVLRRAGYVRRIVEAVRYKGNDDHEDVWSILCEYRDEIEAGYRKQSEGEWIDFYKGKYTNPLYVCSVCEKGTLLRVEGNELGQPETVQALSSFCPNCGAKMKGESK